MWLKWAKKAQYSTVTPGTVSSTTIVYNCTIFIYKYVCNDSYPIGSMYAIYGNIYHQYTPFMLAYIPYMDPMGTVANVSFFPVFCFSLLNLCKSEHSFDMFWIYYSKLCSDLQIFKDRQNLLPMTTQRPWNMKGTVQALAKHKHAALSMRHWGIVWPKSIEAT